jgi:hypothetical protein
MASEIISTTQSHNVTFGAVFWALVFFEVTVRSVRGVMLETCFVRFDWVVL